MKAQNGSVIKQADSMVLACDADIAMVAIQGSFVRDYGIKPLSFTENVHSETSVDDDVVCPGNSLGSGVIVNTSGKIKAYGQPRLEITTPFVQGNSGGPVIHVATGRVIGMVTEAELDRVSKSELAKRAAASPNSKITDVAYFAHRVDTVRKWRACSLQDFYGAEKTLAECESSLIHTGQFMYDLPGWDADPDLVKIFADLKRFIDDSAAKSHITIKQTDYVNANGVVVRRDVKVRSKTVSAADYEQAFNRFLRSLDWKIKGDLEAMNKLDSLGYIQIERRRGLADFAKELALDLANFQEGVR